MTYKEYRNRQQKEVDKLPLFFAFSNEQLDKHLKERNATIKDIYKLGDTGGFYLKKDAEIIRAYFGKQSELTELMNDPEFAEDAFLYEMDNHEYAINYYQGDWDVCCVFCEKECEYGDDKDYKDYLKEAGHEQWIPAYEKARERHYKKAESWF